MADTRILESKIEDFVRSWLAEKFGQPFRLEFLPLSGVSGVSTVLLAESSVTRCIVCYGKIPFDSAVPAESQSDDLRPGQGISNGYRTVSSRSNNT